MAVQVSIKNHEDKVLLSCQMNQIPRKNDSIKLKTGMFTVRDVIFDCTDNSVILQVYPQMTGNQL